MNIRRRIIIGAAACMLTLSIGAHANWWWPFSSDKDEEPKGDITTISWEDLIPDDFVQPENPFSTMSQKEMDELFNGTEESKEKLKKLEEAFNYAPVVDELDGKRVKLPAYITPLEFDGQSKLNEFLLVPYLGACIHVPPPPANQVVHANPSEAIEVENPYDAVWAIGIIRAESITSELAESGYQIEVEKILPYTE